jgi:hypothetical protein
MTVSTNAEMLKLPDQLLVRYFRAGELDAVQAVQEQDGDLTITLNQRTDYWRDLGGGLGYVPTGN